MFVASCDMTGVTGTCTVSAGGDGTATLYFYDDGDAGTESAQEYCKGIGGTYTAG